MPIVQAAYPATRSCLVTLCFSSPHPQI
jgi:hypothetical protein